MKKMKKICAALLALAVILSLAACGTSQAEQNTTAVQNTTAEQTTGTETKPETAVREQPTEAQTEEEKTEEATVPDELETVAEETERSDALVIYFSVTGTTKGVAEKIAALENADIYEIVPAQPYTTEDLNYNDRSTRATVEQNTPDARPEIAGEQIDLAGYTTIYIGYPIWWGEEPRIMDTFVESYDFGDAVMIPFCTSGSSGIGRSGKNLEEKAGSGSWLSGGRLQSTISDADLQNWINEMK